MYFRSICLHHAIEFGVYSDEHVVIVCVCVCIGRKSRTEPILPLPANYIFSVLFFFILRAIDKQEHGNNSDRLLVFIWNRIRCIKLLLRPHSVALLVQHVQHNELFHRFLHISYSFLLIPLMLDSYVLSHAFVCVCFLDRFWLPLLRITHTCSHYVIVLEYISHGSMKTL